MTDLRQIRLPDRETAIARGWTHQVQWMDGVLPCFSRVTSGAEADDKADALKKRGWAILYMTNARLDGDRPNHSADVMVSGATGIASPIINSGGSGDHRTRQWARNHLA